MNKINIKSISLAVFDGNTNVGRKLTIALELATTAGQGFNNNIAPGYGGGRIFF